MNRKSIADGYDRLLEDISSLFEKTRLSVVFTYWHIGKYIFEDEQKENPRSGYGEVLIKRLSEDLSERYGMVFSITNLKTMRRFYRRYEKGQISAQLDWSSYVTLLTIRDEKERRLLEKRIINEKLNQSELRKIAARIRMEKDGIPLPDKSLPEPERGLLY
jgi:hypothetical protein